MIWFFLMGTVAGAVGWHMFVMWYGKKLKDQNETPEDVVVDLLHTMRRRPLMSEQELMKFVDDVSARMDKAIERQNGGKTHE